MDSNSVTDEGDMPNCECQCAAKLAAAERAVVELRGLIEMTLGQREWPHTEGRELFRERMEYMDKVLTSTAALAPSRPPKGE